MAGSVHEPGKITAPMGPPPLDVAGTDGQSVPENLGGLVPIGDADGREPPPPLDDPPIGVGSPGDDDGWISDLEPPVAPTKQNPVEIVTGFFNAESCPPKVGKEHLKAFRTVFGDSEAIKKGLRDAGSLQAFLKSKEVPSDEKAQERFLHIARFNFVFTSKYREIRQIVQKQRYPNPPSPETMKSFLENMLTVDYQRDVSSIEKEKFRHYFRQMLRNDQGLVLPTEITNNEALKKQFWRMSLFCLEAKDYDKFATADFQNMMLTNKDLSETHTCKRWSARMKLVGKAANTKKFHESFVVPGRTTAYPHFWEHQEKSWCGKHAMNAFLAHKFQITDKTDPRLTTKSEIDGKRAEQGVPVHWYGAVGDKIVAAVLSNKVGAEEAVSPFVSNDQVLSRLTGTGNPVTRIVVSHKQYACPYPNRGFEGALFAEGHFTTLVKEDDVWWMVDSKGGPKPITDDAVKFYVAMAYTLAVEDDEAASPVVPSLPDEQ